VDVGSGDEDEEIKLIPEERGEQRECVEDMHSVRASGYTLIDAGRAGLLKKRAWCGLPCKHEFGWVLSMPRRCFAMHRESVSKVRRLD